MKPTKSQAEARPRRVGGLGWLVVIWLAAPVGSGPLAQAALASQGPVLPREGLPIERIVVEGCRTVDPTIVEGQIRARVGDPYSSEQCQTDVARILALGLFSNAKVEVATNKKGVILTYTVAETQRVERVILRGNTAYRDKTLLETAELTGVTLVDESRLRSAARLIEERYRGKGYALVKVTGGYEEVEGALAAVLTIREGPQVRLRAVEFEGVTAFSHRALRQIMRTSPYERIWWWLLPRKETFNETTIREDVRRIRDHYVREGYLDADVAYELQLDPDQTGATVRVLVREGQPFNVGALEVRGAKVFGVAEITQQMSLRPDGRYTAAALDADRRAIQRLYGRLGYLTTLVKAETRFAEALNVVDVRIDIVEGPQVRLGAIRLKGNFKTRAHVILREIPAEPGALIDADKLEEGRRRLTALRYFDSVKFDLVEGTRPDEKDLVVEVVEGRTGYVIPAVAYGTEAGLVGSITFEQRNFDIARWPRSLEEIYPEGTAFAGAGQTFRLVAQPGTEMQRYLVGFREPHLLGSDYWLDLSGYLWEHWRDDYDEARIGGRVGVGRRLTEHLSAEVALRGEQIDIDNIDLDAPPDVFEVEGTSVLTSVGLTVAHDTRDDRFDPTRGHRYAATVEQAGALGGDYDFTRLTLRAGWHVPLWWPEDRAAAHVLSVGGRLGFIAGDAPIFERFYAGGTYTMRGFDYRGVGPHVGDEPVGGDFLALASAEYSLPLIENTLRGVLFLDVGSVEESVQFDTIRVSTGFGLRLYVPALGPVPMQFNFGFPLAKDDEDDTQVFTFAVGTQL